MHSCACFLWSKKLAITGCGDGMMQREIEAKRFHHLSERIKSVLATLLFRTSLVEVSCILIFIYL